MNEYVIFWFPEYFQGAEEMIKRTRVLGMKTFIASFLDLYEVAMFISDRVYIGIKMINACLDKLEKEK